MYLDSTLYTTFKTQFGQYIYNVLPFGLTEGPSSWQYYINEKLFKFLGDFYSVYLDNILIYSNTLEEYKQYITQVLERLQAARLQVDIRKSEFHVQETAFLGVIVGADGIRIDLKKIEVILN